MHSTMDKTRKSLTAKLLGSRLLRSKGLIAGEWLPAASGKLFAVMDPATGLEVEQVSAMGAEDAEKAVGAATESFKAWRGKTIPVRHNGCCLGYFSRSASTSRSTDLL